MRRTRPISVRGFVTSGRWLVLFLKSVSAELVVRRSGDVLILQQVTLKNGRCQTYSSVYPQIAEMKMMIVTYIVVMYVIDKSSRISETLSLRYYYFVPTLETI